MSKEKKQQKLKPKPYGKLKLIIPAFLIVVFFVVYSFDVASILAGYMNDTLNGHMNDASERISTEIGKRTGEIISSKAQSLADTWKEDTEKLIEDTGRLTIP